MAGIIIPMQPLLKIIQEMASDGIVSVKLTINDKAFDQNEHFPAFVNFEGYTKDNDIKDYESVDSISPIYLNPIITLQNLNNKSLSISK